MQHRYQRLENELNEIGRALETLRHVPLRQEDSAKAKALVVEISQSIQTCTSFRDIGKLSILIGFEFFRVSKLLAYKKERAAPLLVAPGRSWPPSEPPARGGARRPGHEEIPLTPLSCYQISCLKKPASFQYIAFFYNFFSPPLSFSQALRYFKNV